ncbi:hypothetical protein ABW21_db0207864 [Orbilia brochopaga]|nr:hypothetical protein ABW21_db0207864 [Drechslerella brochopaga]
MERVPDIHTGEPVGSILYENPSQVSERHIINILPIRALGVSNCIKAVAMVKDTIVNDKIGVREAVIKTVILFGVTDQDNIMKIRNAPPPGIPKQPMPKTPTQRQSARGVICRPLPAFKPAAQTHESQRPTTTNSTAPPQATPLQPIPTVVKTEEKYVPPHLRFARKLEDGRRAEINEGKEKEDKKEEKSETNSGGTYVPPHLRFARLRERRLKKEEETDVCSLSPKAYC